MNPFALEHAGLAGWTLVEYGMHRFVLHGFDPFRRCHALHHHGAQPACFGVTTGFWDRVFGTTGHAR